jgi:hypothetical protein
VDNGFRAPEPLTIEIGLLKTWWFQHQTSRTCHSACSIDITAKVLILLEYATNTNHNGSVCCIVTTDQIQRLHANHPPLAKGCSSSTSRPAPASSSWTDVIFLVAMARLHQNRQEVQEVFASNAAAICTARLRSPAHHCRHTTSGARMY